MIVVKTLLFAALTIFLCWFSVIMILACRGLEKQSKHCSDRHKRTRRRKETVLRKILRSLAVVLILLTLLSASALAVSIGKILKNDSSNTNPTPATSPNTPVDSEPDLPASPPISSEKELFSSFRLSEVENSKMLTLDKELIGGAAADMEQLTVAADEQLDAYLARWRQSASFFSFYPALDTCFPAGEDVDVSFEAVSTLDECNAQLRGVGGRLSRHKDTGSPEWIGELCHHLTIRSLDALKFTKYQETVDQQDRLIWLYAELSFAALVNEYIYSRPEGLALSDWYYRTAQVFDYLGGIADTKGLELRMYFLSAVFLRCGYETLKEQGLGIYPNAYDREIWELYAEMLYRVAIRVASEEAEGFYMEIHRIESAVLCQPLPDVVIDHTAKILNRLTIYREWEERYG